MKKKHPQAKHDWPAIQRKHKKWKGSLKAFCEKEGVPYNTAAKILKGSRDRQKVAKFEAAATAKVTRKKAAKKLKERLFKASDKRVDAQAEAKSNDIVHGAEQTILAGFELVGNARKALLTGGKDKEGNPTGLPMKFKSAESAASAMHSGAAMVKDMLNAFRDFLELRPKDDDRPVKTLQDLMRQAGNGGVGNGNE